MINYEVDLRLKNSKDEKIYDNLKNIKTQSYVFSSFCWVFLVLSLYIRYVIFLRKSISEEIYTKFDSLQNTGLWKWLFWEYILYSLTPYGFFEGVEYKEYVGNFDIQIIYQFNELLLSCSFCRIFFAFRMILYLSLFCN